MSDQHVKTKCPRCHAEDARVDEHSDAGTSWECNACKFVWFEE